LPRVASAALQRQHVLGAAADLQNKIHTNASEKGVRVTSRFEERTKPMGRGGCIHVPKFLVLNAQSLFFFLSLFTVSTTAGSTRVAHC
jgi:hypothetical protein